MNRAVNTNEPVEVKKDDVLYGRTPEEQCHPGNIRLKNCIDLHRAKYAEANKANKSKIIRQIVNVVGGRFLKKNKDGHYIVISPRGAREKVGLAMRESMEPNKASSKPSSSSSKKNTSSNNNCSEQKSPTVAAPLLPRNVSASNLNVMAASLVEPISVVHGNNNVVETQQTVSSVSVSVHHANNVAHAHAQQPSSLLQAQGALMLETVIGRAAVAGDLVGESDMAEFLSSLDDAFFADNASVPLIR